MSETTVSAELEPLSPGELSLVAGRSFSLQEVADKLTAPVPEPEDAEERPIPFPDVPKAVQLTDEVRAALITLPAVFARVQMTERRRLSPEELQDLAAELDVIEQVGKLTTARKAAIQETIRHHNDVTAQDQGDALPKRRRLPSGRVIEATPRDKSGHYLLAKPDHPFVTDVVGWVKGWQQRFVSGSTSQSLPLLEELLVSGKITKAEYNGFTREVRVLDDAKITSFLAKGGNFAQRGLQILKAITVRSAPNSSLYGPAKK